MPTAGVAVIINLTQLLANKKNQCDVHHHRFGTPEDSRQQNCVLQGDSNGIGHIDTGAVLLLLYNARVKLGSNIHAFCLWSIRAHS
jgi:hypothetical protein